MGRQCLPSTEYERAVNPMQFRYLYSAATAAVLLLAAGAATAVELGDIAMRSHIGQPLVADIELTGAADAVPVQVAIADADVYRVASIAMHPALAAANLSTFRRDGRRFLRISSTVKVQTDHLPIFFSLTENGQRSLRQATLWLTADPNPPPPPQPLPVPMLLPSVPVAAAAPAPTPQPVPPPMPRPMPPAASEPAPKPTASAAAVQAGAAAPAPKTVMPREVAALPFIAAPALARHRISLPHAPAPAACAARADSDSDSCVALDAKNAALNAHLAELEDKVKQLSAALQGGAGAALPPASAAAPEAAAAKPAAPTPLPPKLVPMGSEGPAPARSGGAPWLAIALGALLVLASGGGAALWLQRRKQGAPRRKGGEADQAADIDVDADADADAEAEAEADPGAASPARRSDPGQPGEAPGAGDAGNAAVPAVKPSFIASVKARLMPGRAAAAPPLEEEVVSTLLAP